MPKPLAVIAGASSGIGAAAARKLAAEGFHVHVAARRAEPLRELADAIGGSCTVADLSSEADAQRLAADVAQLGRAPKLAIYAAGVLEPTQIAGHPLDVWERTIAVNLTGGFLFARELLPLLTAGSRIVFTSSVSARKGARGLAAYSASKSGLDRFAEALQAEHERDGIGVHVLALGPVATPMLDRPGVSPFQLDADEVADVIAYLATLPPGVVMRDLQIRAATKGPFARDAARAEAP
ncbi:SDR family oxidoreductase [Conexibacter sp. JD483]|uniref:SDR family NAD(P)-dependent oxidoreductase n=1 Tax=unclassified Conexibacter TaxID=2627773 RepID=UPI00271FF2C9|nr:MULTISPECIES: SDR family oxidoreductase [unclassified Conexibacter]MDO8189426.1 SDR family oxidoreductase [Conexibacter sp. CPCC 205706]MDO8200762.1 SDR family oxidoreductase [Conexibacter sp. CPCC 205762]MDR9372525.1 SDR family oxidoreductase [Conexibacter sp. JD483]